MKVSLSKKSKLFCLVATLLLGLLPFITTGSSVYASNYEADVTKETLNTIEQDAFSKEIENDLNFILDNATTYDDLGNVESLDFNVLYAKYGRTSELVRLENQVNKDLTKKRFKRADASQCAVVAIQDTLGVSAVTGLISGGIVGLLQRKAVAEVAKLVAKFAFKNIVPAATAASLIWSFGRCMWF